MTELTEVVLNATSYLSNLPLPQKRSSSSNDVLEDFPDCGLMNNDTFSLCPKDDPNNEACQPQYGQFADANATVQCLWDCAWKENPHLGKSYTFVDPQNENIRVNITSTMPKIPVDLKCLDGCTSTTFEWNYNSSTNTAEPDCRNYGNASFLGCYLSQAYVRDRKNTWSILNYFDMAVESCMLSILEKDLYPEGNCDKQGVDLFSHIQLTSQPDTKTFGPASSTVSVQSGFLRGYPVPLKNRYPWQCSLRTPGFTGVHRCGVTLISGPPRPTIFVSAAHCNYVCKNTVGLVVEVCCCLDKKSKFSCQDSDFCGQNPNYQVADPRDFQIACNLVIQEPFPQGKSKLNTKILNIKEIRIHPGYIPLQNNNQKGGPTDGYDISVYIVDDTNFTMNQNFTWPACLPKQEHLYMKGNQGILAGWTAPTPFYYLFSGTTIRTYELGQLWQSEALYERVSCNDPSWMNSSTYYPNGTACYTDAAWASSVNFGMSGSGVMRPFLYFNENKTTTRHSWAGPLSFSRGGDHVVRRGGPAPGTFAFSPYSSNLAVFTDALCYMDWIAAQYNLRLPADFVIPQSCFQSSGSKNDVNKVRCLSRQLKLRYLFNATHQCNFTVQKQCKLYSQEPKLRPATNENFFTCKNVNNQTAICANNCPGVDPNAVVVGGEAALLSLAAVYSVAQVGPNLAGPVLGAGSILTMMGLGRVSMNMRSTAACPAGQCRAAQDRKCCTLRTVRGQLVCPTSC